MPRKKKAPELTFQQHIADFLVRVHGYGVLEQADITDTEHFIAEDQLWAFLTATQADTLKKLTDDYGTDARDEVFKALRKELEHTPLWMLLRHGLKVRGLELRLYYPKPRSAESAAVKKHGENRITFRPHFYLSETNHEIDFVFFLNGLPIVALELKHEKNQTVHDAVAQFAARDHARKIFQHPFLYLAADTSDVMAATDPRREQNFRWHNTGLTNAAVTKDSSEYPVEFLYHEVLAKEQLLEALSFFLVRVPQRDAEDDRPERRACTLFPRYHQSRTVRKVADDISAHFAAQADIGRKYLVNHSAGSGKTLTICWLADRLHSLFKPGRFQAKLTDPEERKEFVYLLTRFVKSYHFLTCFFTFAPEIRQLATLAEYVGPQLIKAGSVSELMKQIRRTEVIKAAVEYQGVESGGGTVKLKPNTGMKGAGPAPKKVSVQDMIAEIQARFAITDEEALYIRQVTEEKAADPVIRGTVSAHRDDRIYLEGAYRGQVNGEIQTAYDERGRYEELSDLKYTDTGGIFDIMAVTVIQHHLSSAA